MSEAVIRVVDCHAFLRTQDGVLFLLMRRSGEVIYSGSWRMVGGKIEAGEKAYEAAVRELREETGLRAHRLWSVPSINAFYEASHDRINLIPVFAAEVLSSDVKLSPEHSEFVWLDYKQARLALPWPAQRHGLDMVYEYIVADAEVCRFTEIDLSGK